MSDVENDEAVDIPALSSPTKSVSKPVRKSRKKLSRRKRLTRPKQRGLYKQAGSVASVSQDVICTGNVSFSCSEPEDDNGQGASTSSQKIDELFNDPLPTLQEENEYFEEESNVLHSVEESAEAEKPCEPSSGEISIALIGQALENIQENLQDNWFSIADQDGFHFLYIPQGVPKSIQREIFVQFNGEVQVFVHCVELPKTNPVLSFSPVSVPLSQESVDKFCERGLFFCNRFMQFKVCTGADCSNVQEQWKSLPDTYIDLNPYREEAYQYSCRSINCSRIVPLERKFVRCKPCMKVHRMIRARNLFSQKDEISQFTPNVYLSHEKAQAKLKQVQEEKRKLEKKLQYLELKVANVLDKQGVDVDEDLNEDLHTILNKSNLSDTQRLFLEEQLNVSGKADPRAHRWHPSMIRLAIHLKSTSATGYRALKDSGFVKLPSERTLYDYTHYISTQDGVNTGLLKQVSKDVNAKKLNYQKFHTLIFDEMHISQNLVYSKTSGKLVGYVHLDEVDTEMKAFEDFLKGVSESEVESPPLATKVLAYMVKGVTTNIKCVIASYPCKELNKDMLYARTWNVISQLEGAGVKIIALVSDGSAVNRAFYKQHSPITKTTSGIVFDTLNFCSGTERPLYFISDVAHLIKTMRNCLYKSREGAKRYRSLTVDGQKMLWNTIVKLYEKFKNDTLRKSYKLNAHNVFLNSYSCMKVMYAAQIFSNTVADDISKQGWPGTEQLVKFLKFGNKFFDCLNGAHSSQAIKHLQDDLAPYSDPNDKRFDWLDDYLKYLDNWKKQSEELNMPPAERAKTMLSLQTLEGIEIAVKGFKGATRYLLGEAKAKFIMARTFSQDPLENYFSRQRASVGGSTNPNAQQFQRTQVALAVSGQMRMRRRKANVEDDQILPTVISEPLPKRPRKGAPK